MTYRELLNKIRQWDNRSSHWFFRHFYMLFFQVILVIVFVALFVTTINFINILPEARGGNILEQLLVTQNAIGILITFVILLNSFWMLFLLASLFRIRAVLKNIDYNLSRRRADKHHDDH